MSLLLSSLAFQKLGHCRDQTATMHQTGVLSATSNRKPGQCVWSKNLIYHWIEASGIGLLGQSPELTSLWNTFPFLHFCEMAVTAQGFRYLCHVQAQERAVEKWGLPQSCSCCSFQHQLCPQDGFFCCKKVTPIALGFTLTLLLNCWLSWGFSLTCIKRSFQTGLLFVSQTHHSDIYCLYQLAIAA